MNCAAAGAHTRPSVPRPWRPTTISVILSADDSKQCRPGTDGLGDRYAMKLGWVYDPRFLRHDTGNVHVERCARLEVIVQALRESDLSDLLEPLPFRAASAEQLALVHEEAYVDVVRLMCEEGFTFIGSPDTCICPESYGVAALAAGGVIAACDAVWDRKCLRAFCAVRPPGHHAEVDQALGFCLFNHVAIGAEHLIRHRGASRVAIVDIDAHHGNGTQHIFESRPDVLYISLHERPGSLSFPGTGEADELGQGAGAGHTLNIPLDPGSGLDEYVMAIERHVRPALQTHRPELLLISAGFDALMWDNVANLSLDPDAFEIITAAIVEIASTHVEGRVVSVLEGGYDLGHLGRAVVAHVRGLVRDW